MILKMNLRQIAAASALGLVLVMNATAADAARRAQPRDRPSGQWTRHTEGQRTENGRESHSTLTNRNGKEATRDVSVERNAEAGTRNRTVVDTGPNGGQRTVNDATQRTENGFTRDQTVTRANGTSASRNTEVVNDRDSGTRTRDTTITGTNGGQSTNSVITQRTEDGYTRSSTATGPNGREATRDVTATYDPATGTFTKDVAVNGGAPKP
jgi:hypothetical protein